MTDTMLHRLSLALTPVVHHGISDPAEAAKLVLDQMRRPTSAMVDAFAIACPEAASISTERLVAGMNAAIDVAMAGDG